MNNLIEYIGIIDFSTFEKLILNIKENREVFDKKFKKVIIISIEILENIYKYNNNFVEKKWINEFHIIKLDNNFKIISRNVLLNIDIEYLKARIELLKTKSKTQLKKIYFKKLLNTKSDSKNGGAGLGIVTMMKMSSNFNYSITLINEETSLYEIDIII